jgi:hypothetical protein
LSTASPQKFRGGNPGNPIRLDGDRTGASPTDLCPESIFRDDDEE